MPKRIVYVETGEIVEFRFVNTNHFPKSSKGWGSQMKPDRFHIVVTGNRSIDISSCLLVDVRDGSTGRQMLPHEEPGR